MTDMTDIHPDVTVPADIAELMDQIGYTGQIAYSCHQVSLAIVQSGIFPGARVARGGARGVMGQHSWVIMPKRAGVLDDPYSPTASVLDATLWSYDADVTNAWVGPNLQRHWPHQSGHFMQAGMPSRHGGEIIRLVANTPLSREAQTFLDLLGPLDIRGWMEIAHLPVEGWPAGEIYTAMLDTPGLGVLIPIDVVGMTTTLNPDGLYLETKEQS